MNKKKNSIPTYFLPMMLSVVFFFIMMSGGIISNDFLWHVKVGEWITENFKVPTYGVFSWVAREFDLYWTSHEWLGEVILYLIDHFTGDIGVWALCMISGIITIFLIARHNKNYIAKNIIFSSVFFVTLPVVLKVFTIPRPQLFSSLFFFAVLAILYTYVERDTKWIWAIPGISLLWGNIHGGMATLCYISLFVFLIATFKDFSIGRVHCESIGKKRWLKLLLITVLSIVAICLNPNGVKTISFVFSHMGDARVMATITEWAAPDIKQLNSLVCAIPIGFCCISLISTKKNIKTYDLMMFVAMAFLFLRSARFSYYFTISMAFYYFKYMPEFLYDSKIVKSLKNVYVTLSIVLLVATIGVGVMTFNNAAKIKDRVLSDEALQKVEELGAERAYNFYDLGGELIYYGHDVFMDGRADMYQGEVFNDYYSLTKSLNDYQKTKDIIEKYQFDAFLCIPDEPLNMYLEMTRNYEEYYKDDSIRIWVPLENAEQKPLVDVKK